MKIFSLVLLLLIGGQSWGNELPHNVIDCEIYNMDGLLIRRLPGKMCIFLKDGSFLSAQKDRVAYYDHLRNELWSHKIYPHHQMNTSLDQNHFLILGSDVKKIENKKTKKIENVRADVLYVLNKKGDILKSFDAYEERHQFNSKIWQEAVNRRLYNGGARAIYKDVDWEFTHANSFYEIPQNKISEQIPAFKEGNYIINDLNLMWIYVLSSDLKRVLWQSSLIKPPWILFHDVQVIPNSSSLLIYDNGTKDRGASRIMEYDLLKKEIVWQHPKVFSSSFFTYRMGGLQLLPNGNILYNDLTKVPQALEIQRDGSTVWSMIPKKDLKTSDKMRPFQQINRMNLTDFLKNHRGL